MAKFLIVFVAVTVALATAQDYSPTNYNAGDSGRSETVAPDGSVQGQYSYTDPNGKLITVKYRAGKDGFQVEGDHLPKAPNAGPSPSGQASAPAHHQNPAAAGYNPFHNPHVPAHLYQAAPTHPSAAQAAPTHPPQQNPAAAGYNPFYNPDTANYNPLHNPHVPAHLYKDAPRSAPVTQAPTPAAEYNPFHNPHVPAHLYQAAPTHAPAAQAAPTHAPNSPAAGYNPFYNPDIANYNPLHNPHVPAHLYKDAPKSAPAAPAANPAAGYNPFHNPHVPDHLYQQAPQQNNYQQPSAGSGPAGSFHPNALPGASQKAGGCGGFKFFC